MSLRQRRVLGLMVVSSLILHLAALGALPSPDRLIEPLWPVLEVVLLRPPKPEPVVERPAPRISEPSPLPPRPAKETKPVARVEPPAPPLPRPAKQTTPVPRVESAAPPPPRPVLALPESAAPVFDTPVPKPSADAPPAPSAKPAAANVAPQSPRGPVETAPASFDAAYLRNPAPRYPLVARRNGVEGTVRVKVLVTRDGRPAQVQLDQTSGSSVLDAAALEAVREWRFVPARRGEERIESWVEFPVVFKLRDAS